MSVFTMPSLGADMEAGTLVEWLKQPGERVKHGDIIAVVETDKGAIEVEVFEDGQVQELLVEEGSKVPVGTALARISDASQRAAQAIVPPSPAPPAAPPAPLPSPLPEPEPVRKSDTMPPPQAPAPAMPGLRASPAARQLAKEQGVDLAQIAGTGPDGAILHADIAAMLASKREAPATDKPARTAPDLAPMRRAIAAAMAKSKREIPHYYLSHSFELSCALNWLEAYNARHSPPERLLLGVLLLKAVALALRDFPEFNGFYRGDRFEPSAAIHVGNTIAIRGGGLAAPAILNTDTLPLAQLMNRLRDLVARTRAGNFRSSQISDPTITVSSLGERGVEALWPIIYPPQVAIVGFGSLQDRVWSVEGGLVVRPVMTVTLAADHRANDGHRGALLLRHIADLLSQPEHL